LDLKEKEDEQIEVLQEYAGRVQTVSIEEIRQAVSETISRLQNEEKKADLGGILKDLFSPGGGLDGKPAERAEVARVVKDIISGS
jgi:uncharacterized protein